MAMEQTARPDLDRGLGPVGKIGFAATILVSILYVAYSVYLDASAAHVHATAYLPFLLLLRIDVDHHAGQLHAHAPKS